MVAHKKYQELDFNKIKGKNTVVYDVKGSLSKEIADKAIEISVTTDNETGENIEHYVHPVDKSRKAELLIELIETEISLY